MTFTGTPGSGDNKEYSVTVTIKTNLTSTILNTASSIPDDSEVEKNKTFSSDDNGYSLTDTLAAIVSAVLALVFLIMIVCLIQVIKRRRQEHQGNRLNREIIHTITTQTFGANMGAYRHVPISNTFSWESVTSNHSQVFSPEPAEEVSSTYQLSGNETYSSHRLSPGEALSSHQLSERTSYISASSESFLVTAILHPPPLSEELVGPEYLHSSPLVQRALSFKSDTISGHRSSSSNPTTHINSNSKQRKKLTGASCSTEDFTSKEITAEVETSTSYG